MKKIAIIGLGQLGSRHLQALANVKNTFDIELVDISDASLGIAVDRFNEMPAAKNFKGEIKKCNSVNELSNILDLVIIACNSKERRFLVESLLATKKVENIILEKVLFPSIEDYSAIGNILKQKNVKAWVNCSRRMMPSYKKIKSMLSAGANIGLSVSGSNWGMGSNAIHFIDLFCFLTDNYSLKLNYDLLDDNNPIESKRVGYLEFTGTYTGTTEAGSFLKITSYDKGSLPIQIIIDTPYERITINEYLSGAIYSSEKNNWKQEPFEFQMLFQSQITTILVDNIFNKQNCDLPTYEEASKAHIVFLESLLEYLNSKHKEKTKICLIT